MSELMTIKGAGGGGKGGSKNARKPYIQKDSVSSVSTLKALYGLSEGEVEGLVDGAKSIYLEGTPLVDDNGNDNFTGVSYEFVEGTNEQDYIKGFPDVSNEIGVNVELKQGIPYVKAINNTQLSATRVRLRFGRLAETNAENGDITGTKVEYAIDLQTDGGAYETVVNGVVNDKASAGYERTHRIDLPRATNGWQIRVRRLTPNSDSDLLQNDMFVDAVAEVIDAKLRYPNTAMLGLSYDAETFQSVAKVAVHLKGKRILVPSNYNGTERTYTGIWNGTFKEAYSNNPAWVMYDLLTQWRYGLGDRIDASMVDKWSLYQLGQYCDQMVDDGKGDQEPRFTCNVYLQKQEDAFTVLSNIAGIFRAMSYWNGERIVLDADMPQDPVYTFSRANVVDGLFNYTGSRARDRHTLVKVAWDNPANNYSTEYEFVRDERGMAKYGVRVLDLSAFACTSQAQAQRAGLWALETEQLETRQVGFAVGLDGFIPQVGNIVNISDELFAGRANGGRVSKINGSQITLDRDVTTGDTLVINGRDGRLEKRTITAINGKVVTVNAAFNNAEVQNVWAIESADLMLMKFRVMSITQNDDMTFNITALQHEPQKYDAIDYGVHVEPTPITVINPDTVSAPDYVNLSATYRVVQGQNVATLVIEWEQVKDAVAYEIEWRKDNGTWIRLPRTGNTSIDIEGIYSGKYQARVRSISAFDVSSQPKVSNLTDIQGKAGKPDTPTMLRATGLLFGMRLEWAFASGSQDTDYTEIEQATAPDTNVSLLGQFSYPTDNHDITGLQGGLTLYYRARIVDKLGFKSDWTDWVNATTDNDADKVLDILSGQITKSQLHQSLSTPIDKISGIDADVNNINSQLPSLNVAIDSIKSQLPSLNSKIAQAKRDIANAQSQLATAVSNINTERNRITGAIKNIGKLQQQTDEQKQQVNSLTTKQNQLSSSIEQVNTTIVNNNESLTQQINSINAKADKASSDIRDVNQALANERESRTTAVNEISAKFDGLEIGGRNLFAFKNIGRYGGGSVRSLNSSYYQIDGSKITVKRDISDLLGFTVNDLGNAKTLIVSGYSDNQSLKIYYKFNNAKQVGAVYPTWSGQNLLYIISVPDGAESLNFGIGQYPNVSDSQFTEYYLDRLKLEKGNKATDWTPAPEDVQADIAQVATESNANINSLRETVTNADSALSTRIDSLDAEFKQADNQINASINQQAQTSADADKAIGQRIDGINTQVGKNKSSITALTKSVSDANKAISQARTDLSAEFRQGIDQVASKITSRLYVRGTGYNRSASRVVKLDDKDYAVGGRGIALVVIKRSDLSVLYRKNYDTYRSGSARTALAEKLNSLDDTVIVVLTSWDAITWQSDLLTAVARCGGSSSIPNGRTPYALVGIPDIGEGNGLEVITNGSSTAPFAEIATTIIDGTPSGINSEVAKQVRKANARISEEVTARADAVSAVGKRIDSVEASFNSNKASVSQQIKTLTDADSATAQRLSALDGSVKGAQSKITALEKATSDNTQAISTTHEQLSAKFDGLEIGGRNLVENSKGPWSGGNEHRFTVPLQEALERAGGEGAQITISFDVKMVKGDYLLVYCSNRKGELRFEPAHTFRKIGNKKTRLSFVTEVKKRTSGINNASSYLEFYSVYDTGDYHTISNIKIEKGNKSTDWTPAPEDVQADIDATQASLDEFKQTTASKDQAQTIVNNQASSRINDAESTINTLQSTKANKDEVASLARTTLQSEWQSAANTAKDEAISVAKADATSKANAAKQQAVSTSQASIDALSQTVSNNQSSTANQLDTLSSTIETNRVSADLAKASVDGGVLHVAKPSGGSLSLNSSSLTGAIKIRLPQRRSLTMMKFKVEIYNYTTAKSSTYDVAGYNHSNGWTKCTATMSGASSVTHSVRFGSDGEKDCIWIGETDTNWRYLKVRVSDFIAGYRNFNADQWLDGWSLSLVTTFDTIDYVADTLNPAKDVDVVSSELTSFKQTQATKDSATAKKLTQLEANLGTKANSTTVNQLSNRVERVDGKINVEAKKVSTLQTTVNNNTASIRTQQQSVDGLSAMSTVTLDVNGYVTGVGSYNDGKKGTFAVRADEFWIASPDNKSKVKPLVYYAKPTTINGVTIPSGLYLDGNLLATGTITGDKIRANTEINAPKISGGQININNKFMVDSDGNMTAIDGYFSGDIAANTIDIDTLKRSAWTPAYEMYIDKSKINEAPEGFSKSYGGKHVSYGSVVLSLGSGSFFSVGSVLFETKVYAETAHTVTQRLISVDDRLAVYLNGQRMYNIGGSSVGTGKDITYNLNQGINTIQLIIINDGGGAAQLVLLGDFIDNNIVKFA